MTAWCDEGSDALWRSPPAWRAPCRGRPLRSTAPTRARTATSSSTATACRAHRRRDRPRYSGRLGFEVDYSYSAALRGFAADLTETQLDAVRDDPDVAFVSENRVAHATAMVPLAPGEPLPPTGVRRIHTSTRTTTREASSSNVAVIDTGIRLSHPDLNVGGGTDCIDPGTPPSDVFGHGTHIAGTDRRAQQRLRCRRGRAGDEAVLGPRAR